MSQRHSEYLRRDRDLYETPPWVTEALLPHLRDGIRTIWEPACGSGKMVGVLKSAGYTVDASDVTGQKDFLQVDYLADAIITNPPYSLARLFILRAVNLTRERRGLVAMLLDSNYDCATTRKSMFTLMPFAKKVVLTRRIVWIERTDGIKAAPSTNHAWYIWDHRHSGPPTLAYA